jgi:hypothetical protein
MQVGLITHFFRDAPHFVAVAAPICGSLRKARDTVARWTPLTRAISGKVTLFAIMGKLT